MTAFRYKAFISYSWADAAWGKWLHRTLETYRTPAALVGREGRHGPVAQRLHPLFKDREEEAAGASVGAAIEAALAASEFLIVICSPRSAASRWVGHEIAWFKTHRDPAKILALIVDGEPGSGAAECFPQALTHRVGPDLRVTGEFEDAPLAADARASGDGKRKARLKLAAALLGVGLDELVKRDDRRRALRARLVVGASLALAAAMSALAWAAVQARNEADHQRAESDGLVEFMLTDLREKLEPVGRLDALDVVGQRALKYYAGQKPGNLDADALGRRSRALHLVGEVRNIRGDSTAGLAAFRQAAATTAELLARDPGNAQRIFDHAQSVFWVGYIAYERGETKDAEAQFREYKRLADQLVAIDSKKPEWQMEVSYAESNLGVMLFGQGRFAEAEPAFARALKLVEAVAANERYDADRQIEIGMTISWLGEAKLGLQKNEESLALHRRQMAIYERILRQDPANAAAKNRLSVALQYIANIQFTAGNTAMAITDIGHSLRAIGELRKIEPGNTEWRETEVRALLGKSEYLFYADRLRESGLQLAQAQAGLDDLVTSDPTNTFWSEEMRGIWRRLDITLALARDEPRRALQAAQNEIARLGKAKKIGTRALRTKAVVMHLLAGDALSRLRQPSAARSHWQAALNMLLENDGSGSLATDATGDLQRFQLLRRLGRTQEAASAAKRLERRGNHHPAFLRES